MFHLYSNVQQRRNENDIKMAPIIQKFRILTLFIINMMVIKTYEEEV